MTKKKHEARERLKIASNKFSEEIAEGKWDHLPDRYKPIAERTDLIRELEKRCPGYTKDEYKDAIARSLFTWR